MVVVLVVIFRLRCLMREYWEPGHQVYVFIEVPTDYFCITVVDIRRVLSWPLIGGAVRHCR